MDVGEVVWLCAERESQLASCVGDTIAGKTLGPVGGVLSLWDAAWPRQAAIAIGKLFAGFVSQQPEQKKNDIRNTYVRVL